MSFPLCSTCRSLFIRPNEPLMDDTVVAYDQATISQSSKEECPICVILWDFISSGKHRVPFGLPLEGALRMFRSIDQWPDSDDKRKVRIVPGFFSLRRRESETPSLVTIALGRCADDVGGRAMIRNWPNETRTFINTKKLLANTADQSRLKTAEGWIQNCLHNHVICDRLGLQDSTGALPARLIHVEPRSLRLIETLGLASQKQLKYATLSHRWGNRSMPKLCQYNYQSFRKRIDWITLPRVFQEAITVSHRLGIPYIWIDALCIIQDDPSDCDQEISIMGTIYSKAFCNLGAIAAAEDPTGLFVERDPRLLRPFRIPVTRHKLHVDCYAFLIGEESTLSSKSLMERGWVLQERLLSPRSIYFDEQLHWECSELLACETFPEGFPAYPNRWGASIPFRLSKLLEHYDSHENLEFANHLCKRWSHVVSDFSRCQLTYESDTFPALIGIAKYFQATFNDEYLAGLWKRDLVFWLLWYRESRHLERPRSDEVVHPATYRAPSWSWASIKSKVRFLVDNPGIFSPWRRLAKEVPVAEILEATVIADGPDSMGKLSGGHIRICSHMRSGHKRHSLWRANFEWFDYGYDDQGRKFVGDTFFLLLAWRDSENWTGVTAEGEVVKEVQETKPAYVRGLILELTDGTADTYRRVGMFTHPWGEWSTEEHAEKFPEFADFDPENMGEFVEITII